MITNANEATKRPRGRPKGTTKPDKKKGTMIWLTADIRDSVLAYIEVLKQQQEKQS
jgi:hypothetical protein